MADQPAVDDQPALSGLGDEGQAAEDEALTADDLLVEEVSIDGMCGVY